MVIPRSTNPSPVTILVARTRRDLGTTSWLPHHDHRPPHRRHRCGRATSHDPQPLRRSSDVRPGEPRVPTPLAYAAIRIFLEEISGSRVVIRTSLTKYPARDPRDIEEGLGASAHYRYWLDELPDNFA